MVRKASETLPLKTRGELLPASTHLSSMAIKSSSAGNKDKVLSPTKKLPNPETSAYLPPPCSLQLAGQKTRTLLRAWSQVCD